MNKLNTLFIATGMAMLANSSHADASQGEDRSALYPPEETEIPYHVEATRVHYRERIKTFSAEPLAPNQIVFLGDSLTELGGDWGSKLGISGVRNRGISGDVTDGVLQRLSEIAHYQPKAVFMLIGINDLFNIYYQKQIPSPQYVAKNIIRIAAILREKSPRTKLYVQTLLPTAHPYMQENIDAVNRHIELRAKEGSYQLIDIHHAFALENGLMNPSLTNDGTHLNESGYEAWAKLLRPIAKGL